MTRTHDYGMRIYYAHAKCTYGTGIEEAEMGLIKKKFPQLEIVDPGSHEENREKQLKGMRYCLELINRCNILVFSRLLGRITAGVGKEVNHALASRIPVYQLTGNGMKLVKKPVRHLSIPETISYYEYWRTITGQRQVPKFTT